MPGTVTGGNQSVLKALAENAAAQHDLLLESLIEQKIINRHLAEIAGVAFGEEDIELETN